MKRLHRAWTWFWLPVTSLAAALFVRFRHNKPGQEGTKDQPLRSQSRQYRGDTLKGKRPQLAFWKKSGFWIPSTLAVVVALAWWIVPMQLSGPSRQKENAESRSGTGLSPAYTSPEAEIRAQLEKVFSARANVLINRDVRGLSPFYSKNKSGRQTLQHEYKRVRYVSSWLVRRKARLVQSDAALLIDHITTEGNNATVNLKQSATLAYKSKRGSSKANRFGMGTRHRLTLIRQNGLWVIEKDEFTDPLAEEPMAPIIASEPTVPRAITVLSPATSTLSPALENVLPAVTGTRSYNRQAAIQYANLYCGAAAGCGNNHIYNQAYRDLTSYGGDCTNFISQVLGDRNAGGLAQTKAWTWQPDLGMGTAAWQRTVEFAAFLQRSGYANLVTKGRLAQVIRHTKKNPQGAIGRLRPGDVIGYEEDGRVLHFAVVTGDDNLHQPIVNSHTSDRYHVPWEIGWNEKTTYWLFTING